MKLIKIFLYLLLFCVAIFLLERFFIPALLIALFAVVTLAFIHMKRRDAATARSMATKKSIQPTEEHFVSYHYDDVKFYPPKEMVAKVPKGLLRPGAEILLVQEPTNTYDDRAVALYISDHQIGYLLRGTLQDMANEYMESGHPIKVTLSSLKYVGGEYEGYVNISYYLKSKYPKRLGYSDIDIRSIQPTNPDAIPNTPLTKKNIVFSGTFALPLEAIMQLAVDSGAVLRARVTKTVNYLVVGEQKPEFLDENGLSNKEATAAKLNAEGQADIKIIDEKAFMKLAQTNILV